MWALVCPHQQSLVIMEWALAFPCQRIIIVAAVSSLAWCFYCGIKEWWLKLAVADNARYEKNGVWGLWGGGKS